MKQSSAESRDIPNTSSLLRSGFEDRLFLRMLHGCTGIEHFVNVQLRLGPFFPYRYKVIRDPNSLLAAAECRIIKNALFLNNTAKYPCAQRHGLAMSIFSSMRKNASSLGLFLPPLDDFSRNEKAINWNMYKFKMKKIKSNRTWIAPLTPNQISPSYYIFRLLSG